jgi:predicted lipoprotein
MSWVCIGSMALAITVCQPDPHSDDTGTSASDSPLVGQLLADVGPFVMVPALETFGAALQDLTQAVQAWALQPTDATAQAQALNLAQSQWRISMAHWQSLEAFQIGPAASGLTRVGGQDLRDELYSWPTVNPCRVDQKTADGTWADANFFEVNLVNATGLDAMEHLLFGDLESVCPPQVNPLADGSWAAMGESGIVAARAGYALVLAQELEQVANTLISAWDPLADDFSAQLTGKAEEPLFATNAEALDAVFQALFYLETQAKDRKLAHPIGQKECVADHCAEDLEGLPSGETLVMLRANLAGFDRLFSGGDGIGFEELLTDLGHGDLSRNIRDQSTAFQSSLASFEGSLFEAITTGSEAPLDLLEEFSSLTELIKQDMVTVLHLMVPTEAAGDND